MVVGARHAAECGAFIGSFRPAIERALTYEVDADDAAKQACIADEARDLAGMPRVLLGRAVARDTKVDDGAARCRHHTPELDRPPPARDPSACRAPLDAQNPPTDARPPAARAPNRSGSTRAQLGDAPAERSAAAQPCARVPRCE